MPETYKPRTGDRVRVTQEFEGVVEDHLARHGYFPPDRTANGEVMSENLTTRPEAFIELLPPDVGHNLRHLGPERVHVSGDECHCGPEHIQHEQVK